MNLCRVKKKKERHKIRILPLFGFTAYIQYADMLLRWLKMVKVSECGRSELIAVERYLVEAADSLLAFYIVLKVGKHFKAEEKQSETKNCKS